MRFFAHDGKTTHGPATVGELLKLPGFDGETLVCPAGAANSEDWKPALAYPPFKRALLSPEPAAVLPPAPRIKTTPCPRCGHQNPEAAHYCNACGASLDAKREVLPPALETALPRPGSFGPGTDAAEEIPVASSDPFVPLDPMLSFPTAEPPAPMPAPEPAPEPALRPLDPGEMGKVAACEPAEVPIPAWKRPALLAAFVLAAIVASGLAWRMLAPTPMPDSSPMPMPAPAPSAPVPAEAEKRTKPAPAVESDSQRTQGGGDIFIESRAPESKADDMDPLLESLLANETRSAADKAAPMIGQRPAAQSPNPEAKPAPVQSKPLSLPGLDRPVSVADQTALAQVHEQFDFCAQLLTQGAYGDHYDTCLCKDAREAAPYRGRRGFYVSALKKDASAGRLETAAKIISSKFNGGAATVTSHWTSRPDDQGRDLTQTWRLEDGLWCRAL